MMRHIKYKEKADSDLTDRLKDIPSALPALVRAAKVQKKGGNSLRGSALRGSRCDQARHRS